MCNHTHTIMMLLSMSRSYSDPKKHACVCIYMYIGCTLLSQSAERVFKLALEVAAVLEHLLHTLQHTYIVNTLKHCGHAC